MNSFHVRHDFIPALAREALLLIANGVSTPDELQSQAVARDYELGHRQSPDKLLASLRDLDFLKRHATGRDHTLELTGLGQRMAQVAAADEFLFAELVHLRYWSLWDNKSGGEPFSWAYQTVSGMLWADIAGPIETDRLVSEILLQARDAFQIESISFSSSSLLGVLHWLRALNPKCVVGNEFRRRPACAPEAFVLGLRRIVKLAGVPAGVPYPLGEAERTAVCQMLLLDLAGYEEMLDMCRDDLGWVRTLGSSQAMALVDETLYPGLV